MRSKLLAVIILALVVAALLPITAHSYLIERSGQSSPLGGFTGVGSGGTFMLLSVLLVALVSAALAMARGPKPLLESAG